MRRAFLFAAIAFALTLPVCAIGQTTRSTTRPVKGKVLVDRLPNGVEGVVLEKGRLKLKPGYKFTKQSGNKIAVARIRGEGPQVGGTWSCDCGGDGSCQIEINGGFLMCTPAGQNPCKKGCYLDVTVGAQAKNIIIY
jgi:hypothetical protein